MPLKYLLVALALVAATGMVAVFLQRVFTRSEPLMGWEDALELRRALSAGRASLTFTAYAAELPLAVNVTVDGRLYWLPLRRVLVYFRARDAPVFEEPLLQLWRAWGNGTHAGAISALDISDDGSTIYIKYLALSSGFPSRGSSFCLGQGSEDPSYGLGLTSQSGGRVDVLGASYEWSGRRVVKVVRVEVVPCGG
ncbi:MAG: hypothetical protein QXT79_09060 [Thermofilaceae archaeon]